jgi:ankyrin repeat protein
MTDSTATGGHKDVVAALLAAGANASAQNKQGSTPLHFAAGRAVIL